MKKKIIQFLLKQNIRTSNAYKNIFYSLIFRGSAIAFQFLIVHIALSYLSSEKYGVWLTLSSIIGWISFFDIGLGNGLRNQLTKSLVNKKYDLGRRLVSTTYFLLIIIFSFVITLFLIINQFLDWNNILNTDSLSKSELKTVTNIIFCTFVLRFIFSLIGIIAHSYQKSSLNDLFILISNILTLLFIYFLTKFTNENLLGFGIIYTIIPIIVFIISSSILFNRDFKHTKPSYKHIDLRLSKDLLSIGLKFFLIQITSVVLFSTTNFIITQISGPQDVTRYNIAFQYFQIIVMVFSIIGTPYWSAITDAFSVNDLTWIKSSIQNLNKISILFVFIIVIFFLLSDYSYRFWVGSQISISKSLSFSIAIWTIINVLIYPYSIFINATGKLKISVLLSVFNIVAFPVLAIYLGRSQLGVTGVITAINLVLIISSIIIYIQVNRLLQNKAKNIWNE